VTLEEAASAQETAEQLFQTLFAVAREFHLTQPNVAWSLDSFEPNAPLPCDPETKWLQVVDAIQPSEDAVQRLLASVGYLK
jgi:hypothetical protein